jgi:hypothetical protein
LSLEELVKRAKRLEEEGRRQAFERDKPASDALDWFREVFKVTNEMHDIFEGMGERVWANVAWDIGDAAVDAQYNVYDCIREELYTKGECPVKPIVKDTLERADRRHESITGRRCTWLRDVVEPYVMSAAINDMTACLHRCIEKLEELSASYVKEGKCMWRK